LDIERYYHPTLGGRGSFYSLKNLTKKTEMFTTTAYTLIDYDLPTASFVFGFENNEDVKRTIKPRFDVTGNAPPHERTFTITHQCALIYIFGKLNILLFPDTLPQAQRDIFIANSTLDIRKQVGAPNSGWVYMPMNDMRDWHNDPELMNLRLWYSIWYNWKTGAPQDIHDIPPELNNWWALGMLVYFVPTMLLQMTVPRFGWFIYDDEIVNRLQVSPRSVFFVHPSGTWAFFDQHRVYNSYGMDWEVGPNAYDDTLTPAISDMVLEHMVYDFVHLEQEHGSVDTSFTALYTQAVTTGKAAGTLKEEFQPVSRTDLKIKFTKERVAGSGGIEWLQLKCDWYPNPPFYYYEFGYQGGSGQHGYMVDAGGLMDMTLGCVAYTGPIYGTPIFHPILRNTPVTFSSCVMVTNNG
jgi:hypothetical protein